MDYLQQFIGLIAFGLGLFGTVVYVRSVLDGRSKPHLYTWLVWGIITGIGFLAQIYDNAGPGSWAMGISSLACLFTAALALKYGEKEITRSDKIALFSCLSAIIPWLLTKDPLGSVIMISIIDAVAFYPTFRKSWKKPHEENLPTFYIANIKLTLSLFAMTNFTVITTCLKWLFYWTLSDPTQNS